MSGTSVNFRIDIDEDGIPCLQKRVEIPQAGTAWETIARGDGIHEISDVISAWNLTRFFTQQAFADELNEGEYK